MLVNSQEFLVQRSRFLAALNTRLGLRLAKTTAMRVLINATGCPAPVSDRTGMKSDARSVPLGLPLWALLFAFPRSYM